MSDPIIPEPKFPYHHGRVREACMNRALEILEVNGLHQLSLRKIAKDIGVSHNAPYRWFKTREDLLVELTIVIFDEIQLLLIAIIDQPSGDPEEDFKDLARVFFSYARHHPQRYRLLAGSSIGDNSKHPKLLARAAGSLKLVRDFLSVHAASGVFRIKDSMRTSIHCISAIHGYCTLVIEDRFELLSPSSFNIEEQFEFNIQQLINGIKN